MESFNGKLRDELLNVEVFDTLWEAKVLAERWRREYNQRRPHSALAYRPPAPEARLPRSQAQSSIPMEWTSNGPRSNLESGLVPGGRSTYIATSCLLNTNQKPSPKPRLKKCKRGTE